MPMTNWIYGKFCFKNDKLLIKKEKKNQLADFQSRYED